MKQLSNNYSNAADLWDDLYALANQVRTHNHICNENNLGYDPEYLINNPEELADNLTSDSAEEMDNSARHTAHAIFAFCRYANNITVEEVAGIGDAYLEDNKQHKIIYIAIDDDPYYYLHIIWSDLPIE